MPQAGRLVSSQMDDLLMLEAKLVYLDKTKSISCVMTIFLLSALPIVFVFIVNRFLGSFIGSFLQGAGSYTLSYIVVRQLIEAEINSIDFIASGAILAIVLSVYSKTQDDNAGPSAIRAEIQGVGVYAALAALLLAIFT